MRVDELMKTSRDISLNIGKGIYTINTPLDDDELDRVKALINEASDPIRKGIRQEDILMLTCLRLAYSLDSVNEKLKSMLTRLEDME